MVYFAWSVTLESPDSATLTTLFVGDDLYPERIDEENKEMTKMERLPDVERHNRMLHKSAYRNELYIKNFKPKADHLPPVPFR